MRTARSLRNRRSNRDCVNSMNRDGRESRTGAHAAAAARCHRRPLRPATQPRYSTARPSRRCEPKNKSRVFFKKLVPRRQQETAGHRLRHIRRGTAARISVAAGCFVLATGCASHAMWLNRGPSPNRKAVAAIATVCASQQSPSNFGQTTPSVTVQSQPVFSRHRFKLRRSSPRVPFAASRPAITPAPRVAPRINEPQSSALTRQNDAPQIGERKSRLAPMRPTTIRWNLTTWSLIRRRNRPTPSIAVPASGFDEEFSRSVCRRSRRRVPIGSDSESLHRPDSGTIGAATMAPAPLSCPNGRVDRAAADETTRRKCGASFSAPT